jgi:hypothetical protein
MATGRSQHRGSASEAQSSRDLRAGHVRPPHYRLRQSSSAATHEQQAVSSRRESFPCVPRRCRLTRDRRRSGARRGSARFRPSAKAHVFEDDLAREYRELAARLPAAAFFDVEDPRRPLPPLEECLEHYVRYFDLSNQQVFLRMERRVGRKTWGLWADGIRDNLERAGFHAAWEYIRRHSERSYNELASFYEHWSHDPAYWAPPIWRRPAKALRRAPNKPEPWTSDEG